MINQIKIIYFPFSIRKITRSNTLFFPNNLTTHPLTISHKIIFFQTKWKHSQMKILIIRILFIIIKITIWYHLTTTTTIIIIMTWILILLIIWWIIIISMRKISKNNSKKILQKTKMLKTKNRKKMMMTG